MRGPPVPVVASIVVLKYTVRTRVPWYTCTGIAVMHQGALAVVVAHDAATVWATWSGQPQPRVRKVHRLGRPLLFLGTRVGNGRADAAAPGAAAGTRSTQEPPAGSDCKGGHRGSRSSPNNANANDDNHPTVCEACSQSVPNLARVATLLCLHMHNNCDQKFDVLPAPRQQPAASGGRCAGGCLGALPRPVERAGGEYDAAGHGA